MYRQEDLSSPDLDFSVCHCVSDMGTHVQALSHTYMQTLPHTHVLTSLPVHLKAAAEAKTEEETFFSTSERTDAKICDEARQEYSRFQSIAKGAQVARNDLPSDSRTDGALASPLPDGWQTMLSTTGKNERTLEDPRRDEQRLNATFGATHHPRSNESVELKGFFFPEFMNMEGHVVEKQNLTELSRSCKSMCANVIKLLRMDIYQRQKALQATVDVSETTVGLMLDGCAIDNLLIGGPAHDSNELMKGDIIVAVDHQPVDSDNVLMSIVGSDQPGSSVILTVKKGGSDKYLSVELVRKASKEIADRRRLFELFTALKAKAQCQNLSPSRSPSRSPTRSHTRSPTRASTRELPPGWEIVRDPQTTKFYFYNNTTGDEMKSEMKSMKSEPPGSSGTLNLGQIFLEEPMFSTWRSPVRTRGTRRLEADRSKEYGQLVDETVELWSKMVFQEGREKERIFSNVKNMKAKGLELLNIMQDCLDWVLTLALEYERTEAAQQECLRAAKDSIASLRKDRLQLFERMAKKVAFRLTHRVSNLALPFYSEIFEVGTEAGGDTTGYHTSLEHLAFKPLGEETLGIDIGEGGVSLDEWSEYPYSFHASVFGTEDSDAERSLATHRSSHKPGTPGNRTLWRRSA